MTICSGNLDIISVHTARRYWLIPSLVNAILHATGLTERVYRVLKNIN